MNIWVPRCKIIEPNRELVLRAQVAGFWSLSAVRPDGRRRLLAEFPNLITDNGLNDHGTDSNNIAGCQVGTGNNTPAFTDSALQTPIAFTGTRQDTSHGYAGAPDHYRWHRTTFRFGAGVAAGNLAEIGIRTSSGGGTSGVLYSRALILNGSGVPTTITILSDEVLDATYEWRLYPPLGDASSSFLISGASHNYTMRANRIPNLWGNVSISGTSAFGFQGGRARATAYRDFVLAAPLATVDPAGTALGNTFNSGANAAYVNNSLQRDFTETWDLNSANHPNFISGFTIDCGSFSTGSGGAGCMLYQMSVTPVIQKDATKVLTMTWRHSWSRRII